MPVNLERPNRGFSNNEFSERTTKVQTLMNHNGIAGILLMSEQDVRYFTGFQTLFWQSPTRPWFLFVPTTGKPIAIIPEIGAELMRRSWIEDIRTWNAPNPKDDGISLLIELLMPFAKERSKIGLMKGHETKLQMPLADWERLTTTLQGIEIVDITGIVQRLRMVKSTAEIQKIAYICAIGSAAFETVPEFLHKGMPLEEVFQKFRLSAIRLGADDAPYVVGAADQGGYSDVISPPTKRPLKHGDIIMLDTGCTWDGYFCDFDRNWSIEYADEDSKRAYDILWRATQAGIEAAKPGNTCQDLFSCMSAILAEMDQSEVDIGRLGHGLGMQLTEQPSHASFDTTELKENMVITIEPSLRYGDGLMMVHEENIVVRPDGPQLLTKRAPIDLPVIT